MSKGFQLELPSLKEATEFAKVIKKPLNGLVKLVGITAPQITVSGINVSQNKAVMDANTIQASRKGLLVVEAPEGGEVKAGDVVFLMANPMGFEFTKSIVGSELLEGFDETTSKALENTKEGKYMEGSILRNLCYKKYVVLLLHPTQFSCIINTDYEF